MSPNNTTINKLSENNDSINDIINGLNQLVIAEKRCISYTYLSLKYRVHVKQAIEILDQFVVEQRNNGNDLCLNYLLFGNNDNNTNDNEIKLERFMIVKESDMSSVTDWFQKGFNKHIYSVCFSEDNDSIDLNFDEYEYEVNDKKDLIDLQNLTYVSNPNIEFRTNVRRRGVKPTIVSNDTNDDKCEQTKSTSNGKNDSGNKPKNKTNTKGKNAKKNRISNMFSKNKKKIKEENEEKECIDITESVDPFKSDSEEEIKSEVKEENEDSMEPKVISETEEVMEETKPKPKNKKKRHSKNSLNSSEDEEEIIATKKRSKRYKRVRLISDTDSEEESKEESAIHRFVTKKNDSKPVKRVEERQETHVDEDGYVVTKTVKKEVEVVRDDSKSKPKAKEEKNESKEKTNIKEITKTKLNKNVDKKEVDVVSDDSKSKPMAKEEKNESKEKTKTKLNNKNVEKNVKNLKENKSKNQSSITSFFKPKPLSS